MAAENDKGIIKYVPNALTIGRLVLTVVFLAMILYTPKFGDDISSNYLLVAFILFELLQDNRFQRPGIIIRHDEFILDGRMTGHLGA